MSPSAESTSQPASGVRLPDRYEIRRHIATGGTASVWCAEDRVLGRSVAIKLLAERFTRDQMAVKRFEREARAAARVSAHPHVVTIFDVGEIEPIKDGSGVADPGPPRGFIVMEHLTGGTVADALRLGTVERDEALRWLREAASALDHAHQCGIVHRDVKPANFLLDNGRVLHVADFGIARLLSEDTITTSGELFGTAAYLSPEQAQGREATSASDRYSLAIAAFELLTGQRPFTARHFAAQARQHIEGERPRASERRPDLPAAVDPVLIRGMAQEPQDRFDSAGAFVAALEAALEGEIGPDTTRVLAPQPQSVPPLALRPPKSGKAPGAAGAAVKPPRSRAASRAAVGAAAAGAAAAGAAAAGAAAAGAANGPGTAAAGAANGPGTAPAPGVRSTRPRPAAAMRANSQRPAGKLVLPSPIKPVSGSQRRRGRVLALLALVLAGLGVAGLSLLGNTGSGTSHRPRATRLASRPLAARQPAKKTPTRTTTAAATSTASPSPAAAPPSVSSETSTTPPAGSGTPAGPSTPASPSTQASPSTPVSASTSAADLQLQGHQQLLDGSYGPAVATLRQALSAADPSSLTYAYALYDLGRALTLSGNPDAAIPILEQRLKIPDQTSVVQAALDQARQAAGQSKSAPASGASAGSGSGNSGRGPGGNGSPGANNGGGN